MTTVRTTAPPVARAGDWHFPTVADSRLDNGLRVLVYDCPGQYVVSASLLFDVSLSAEPRRLEGVAGLTGRCLTRGAAGRSAEEFADAVAACGADLDASAFADAFAVRLAAPATLLAPALSLMADAVIRPTLSLDEFAQEKRLRLQEIDQGRAYPNHVAMEELDAALFGTARSARSVGGAADTVEQVERDDVEAYSAAHLKPGVAMMIIAGDFGTLDPLALVERSFGDWRDDRLEPVVGTPQVVSATPQLLLIDWPEAPQSTIRLGGAGITRADPRWPALFVANFAVGGNFSSRINTVLREEKGVTYGANSSLESRRGIGLATVSTAVRSDATAASVADIVSILAGAVGNLSDEEVDIGVRAATDSAALGYERADAVVARVEMLVSQGLPLDHVDTNLSALRAVTSSSANAAYADIVDPSRLAIVVVGDATLIREPLQAWGYADLRDVTPVE